MSPILVGWALIAVLGQRSDPSWVWAKPKSCVSVLILGALFVIL